MGLNLQTEQDMHNKDQWPTFFVLMTCVLKTLETKVGSWARRYILKTRGKLQELFSYNRKFPRHKQSFVFAILN